MDKSPSYTQMVELVMRKNNYSRLEANAFLGSIFYSKSNEKLRFEILNLILQFATEKEE